jgi:hypothetical protein
MMTGVAPSPIRKGAIPAEVAEIFSGYQARWWIAGGYAIELAQPSALTTPIGHDTPVPWSGQYSCGFLASDRYCWCK